MIIIFLIALFSIVGCDYWDNNPVVSPVKEQNKQIKKIKLVCENGYCTVR